MPFNPKKPYYDLPKLPPSQSLDSTELLRAPIGAAEAFASLSTIAKHLLNQAALFKNVILLEAKASSEIEKIITYLSRADFRFGVSIKKSTFNLAHNNQLVPTNSSRHS